MSTILLLSASWSLRPRITGSRLKLNFWIQHINYSGKKTWSNFVANLHHPNFYLSNITGWPFKFRPFYAKLSYYLLQPLLKLKIYYSHFWILISPYVWAQEFLMKFTFHFHEIQRILACFSHLVRVVAFMSCRKTARLSFRFFFVIIIFFS